MPVGKNERSMGNLRNEKILEKNFNNTAKWNRRKGGKSPLYWTLSTTTSCMTRPLPSARHSPRWSSHRTRSSPRNGSPCLHAWRESSPEWPEWTQAAVSAGAARSTLACRRLPCPTRRCKKGYFAFSITVLSPVTSSHFNPAPVNTDRAVRIQ